MKPLTIESTKKTLSSSILHVCEWWAGWSHVPDFVAEAKRACLPSSYKERNYIPQIDFFDYVIREIYSHRKRAPYGMKYI